MAVAASICSLNVAAVCALATPLISSPSCILRFTGEFISVAFPCAAVKSPTLVAVCCAAVTCARGSSGVICAACVASIAVSIAGADVLAVITLASILSSGLACAVPAVVVGTATLPVIVPVSGAKY